MEAPRRVCQPRVAVPIFVLVVLLAVAALVVIFYVRTPGGSVLGQLGGGGGGGNETGHGEHGQHEEQHHNGLDSTGYTGTKSPPLDGKAQGGHTNHATERTPPTTGHASLEQLLTTGPPASPYMEGEETLLTGEHTAATAATTVTTTQPPATTPETTDAPVDTIEASGEAEEIPLVRAPSQRSVAEEETAELSLGEKIIQAAHALI